MYEVFWILMGFFFWPKKELANKIALWVLIGTSVLKVLQLWHPWHLEKIRSYFLGKALVGTWFTLWDFPHYVVGCLLGWLVVKLIIRR